MYKENNKGIDVSRIRPKGSKIKGSNKSLNDISFIKDFEKAISSLNQNKGK